MPAIVPAAAEDAATILGIQKRAFAEEARLCGDWGIPPLVETVEAVAEHIRTATVLTARSGTRIVGAVRGLVADGVCTIRGLGIEPDHQGRGIGAALLAAVERAHPGVTRFELLTNTVMERNIRFYERHGYRTLELRKHSDRIVLARMGKAASAGGA